MINEFQYIVTQDDISEAFKGGRRHLYRRMFGRKYLAWFGGFLLAIICSLILSFLADSSAGTPQVVSTPPPPTTWKDWLLPFIPMAVVSVYGLVFLRWHFRRIARGHRLVDRPFTLSVEEEGLTFTEPTSKLQYQWAAFYGSKETKNLFLLYLTDTRRAGMLMFQVIPKRAFGSSENAGEFWKLVQIRVQPPASAFPVMPAR